MNKLLITLGIIMLVTTLACGTQSSESENQILKQEIEDLESAVCALMAWQRWEDEMLPDQHRQDVNPYRYLKLGDGVDVVKWSNQYWQDVCYGREGW